MLIEQAINFGFTNFSTMSTETNNLNSGLPIDPLNPECVIAKCESCGGEYQRQKNRTSKLCRKCGTKLVRRAFSTGFYISSLAKKITFEDLFHKEETPEQ